MPEPAKPKHYNIRPIFLAALIVSLLTFAVYGQIGRHHFIWYDDGIYIFENTAVIKGVTTDSMIWAFTHCPTGNWHPLTWMSHMLDVTLFGLAPGMHHLVSLLIHLANSLLVLVVFSKMSRALWPSAVLALLFAIHPLHVESVAWASERKDVLSAFFWFVTMWMYCRYTTNPSVKKYFPVLFFYLLGLMSKPMIVTLPFVLLLIDYWPLKRVSLNKGWKWEGVPLTRLLFEKAPLFLLSAVASVIAIFCQKSVHAVGSLGAYPLDVRLTNAVVSYGTYIAQTLWPVDLAVFYPHPGLPPIGRLIGAGWVVIAITVLAVWYRYRKPWILVGWLWFIGTLVPVAGLIQVGPQARADRYMYIPIIGLLILIIWFFRETQRFFRKGAIAKMIIPFCAIMTFGILSISAWRQTSYWIDTQTLFEHTTRVTHKNYLAQNMLGNVWALRGAFDRATTHYRKALAFRPEYADAYYNLGHTLFSQGKTDDAIRHLSKAVEIKPDYAEAHNYLGHIFMLNDQLDRAEYHLQKAVRLKPGFKIAHDNIGTLYRKKGDTDRALKHFLISIDIDPTGYYAHMQLGQIYMDQGRFKKAIYYLEKAQKINPESRETGRMLSMARLALSKQKKQ